MSRGSQLWVEAHNLATWFRVEGLGFGLGMTWRQTPDASKGGSATPCEREFFSDNLLEREFFIDNLLVDSGFGIRDSGFGFRDSGIGIRDSGIGIRVSGFGFRDLGFGLDLVCGREGDVGRALLL